MLDAEAGARATGPLAVGLAAGLIVALPLAAVLAAAAGLTHEVLVDAATVSVRGTATALRAVDSTLLRVRHIKMRCVACFERLSYPAYVCPNPSAGTFTGIYAPAATACCAVSAAAASPCRPCCCSGRRGSWMRSALFVPASNLSSTVRARSGKLSFPSSGPRARARRCCCTGSSKRCRSLSGLAFASKPAMRPPRPGSGISTRPWPRTIRCRRHPAAEIPKAYVLRLRIGRYRRIVQLIDAAGELFYDVAGLRDLVYLGEANTFVLVIDPLSINDFWYRLPSAERERLASDRSVAPHPQPVYQQTVDRITQMGGQRASRRLAIVLSRADVIGKDFGPGRARGTACGNGRKMSWDSPGSYARPNRTSGTWICSTPRPSAARITA